jgi:hypothetical protein
MSGQLSEFVGSLSTAIVRRADRYVEMLDEARLDGVLRTAEPHLLDRFEKYAADIIDRYVPPGPRNRDSLVFSHLYSRALASVDEGEYSTIAALLGAEAEIRGPLRLTPAQTLRLAEIVERLGHRCARAGLSLHAAFAFDRAGGLYMQVENRHAQDRCLLLARRARYRARDRGLVKVLEAISNLLCGYGYQPYRLLGWVFVQLAALILVLRIMFGAPLVTSMHAVLINYLNPLGLNDLNDIEGLPRNAWVLLVIESYAGAVSLSVFFALVVRRWFRA